MTRPVLKSKKATNTGPLDKITSRTKDLTQELLWASGAHHNLRTPPPRWVAKAFQIWIDSIPELSVTLKAMADGSITLRQAGRLMGNVMTKAHALEELRHQDHGAAQPFIENICNQVDSQLAAVSIPEVEPPRLSLSQQVELDQAAAEAQKECFDAIELGESNTQEICGWLAMNWPDVAQHLNRRALHEWLVQDCRIYCSLKLVEKVCKQIGLPAAKAGRPRKTPTRRKIE